VEYGGTNGEKQGEIEIDGIYDGISCNDLVEYVAIIDRCASNSVVAAPPNERPPGWAVFYLVR